MLVPHDPWPAGEAEALAQQEALRARVEPTGPPLSARTAAGLDVSYEDDGDTGRAVAAVVVLDVATLEVVETAVASGPVTFPYVPGLLAFRELPVLTEALERLTVTPDVLVCDGYGVAHPRRFGLACHVGVLTGLPTFGVAKTAFVVREPSAPGPAAEQTAGGAHQEPGPRRGDWAPLTDGTETLGRVLRTQPGVKPVFVSVGHRVDLDTATALTLALAPRYRLPETTRQADQLSRRLLGGLDAAHRRP
ncbi:endonuclease V [Catellatospora bangladeshensis]|uniref:Endonuclease V n=1 Tax=Catellatospora bangladeshensis TaxID=310355 RepID=A0A8J3JWV5_9ACTN|nr:endonuclease V [Catellatospora bangladeshensis]GIF85159.1 endonuclease V [Catellatospora bangladeshensis]